MDIQTIIQKFNAGETLTPEEFQALRAYLAGAPAGTEQLRSVIAETVRSLLEPLLEARRGVPVGGAGDPSKPTEPKFRVNQFSDLVHNVYNRTLSVEEMVLRGLTSGTDADGGYLVHPQYVLEVLERINDYGVAVLESGGGVIGTNQAVTPKVDSGTTAYWVNEANDITASQPVLSNLTTNIKDLAAITLMSNPLLADSSADIQQLVQNENGIAFAYALDYQLFRGTGSPFTGLLNNTSVITYEVQGGVTALTVDDIEEITTELTDAKLAGAKWYGHRKVFAKLRTLKDLDGNPLYHKDLSAAAPAQLAGFPVKQVEVMPSAPTGTDEFLILTNLKRTAKIWVRQDVSVDISKDATINVGGSDVRLFQSYQSALRTIMRVGIEIPRPEWVVVIKGA